MTDLQRGIALVREKVFVRVVVITRSGSCRAVVKYAYMRRDWATGSRL